MTVILFIAGLALLIGGADLFLKAVDHFGLKWGVSPLIMGLTVVAFATGAPELAISLQAAANGSADLVLGNIIGSNIANILLILGVAGLIKPLFITRRIIRVDVPIVIAASILLYVLSLDGILTKLDGVLLLGALSAYSVFMFFQIKRHREEEVFEYEEDKEELGKGLFFYTKNVTFLVAGLALIVVGSDWMVDGAVEIARVLGLSELVIGLTIVSIGTSLPEIATSISSAIKNKTEIAVANVMGSNLYNILLTVGLTLVIAPNVLKVSDAAVELDMPFMIAVSMACLPIFYSGFTLSKIDSILYLFYYMAYLGYLVLDATHNPLLPAFGHIMIWFVVPITLIYILIKLFFTLKKKPLRK